MKLIIVLVILLAVVHSAAADIVLTEVMYNPAYCSDTSCEWVEIYNNGTEAVNLSSWLLNGNSFGSEIITPGEYIVISRSRSGYEEYFDDNDTLWEGSYKLMEGTFSLSNTGDVVALSYENYSEMLNYSGSWGANGNDRTLQKIDVNFGNDPGNWNESADVNGTPGSANIAYVNENGLNVEANITNAAPVIESVTLSPDEMSMDGVQILPGFNQSKNITITANVRDDNGIYDITDVVVIFKGNLLGLERIAETDNVNAVYSGNVTLDYSDRAGNYSFNVSATDSSLDTSVEGSFEYLSMIAFEASGELLFNDIMPGNLSAVNAVNLINKGNVELDFEIYGSDFYNGQSYIDAGYLQLYNNGWQNLTKTSMLINTGLAPSLLTDINFRFNVPLGTGHGSYKGNVYMVAVEK